MENRGPDNTGAPPEHKPGQHKRPGKYPGTPRTQKKANTNVPANIRGGGGRGVGGGNKILLKLVLFSKKNEK